MSRSRRRHHKERMIAKAERYAKQNGVDPNCYRHIADNLACCSSYCCGNPRRQNFSGKDKLTLQERIQLEREEYFEDEDNFDSYITEHNTQLGYNEFYGRAFWELYQEVDDDDPGTGLITILR